MNPRLYLLRRRSARTSDDCARRDYEDAAERYYRRADERGSAGFVYAAIGVAVCVLLAWLLN